MKAVCRRAGLAWRSPHEAGRDSYATNALAGGATVPEVMESGRWEVVAPDSRNLCPRRRGRRPIADLFDADPGPDRHPAGKCSHPI